ncbi:MAG: DNA repair exonuclease [Candidatus Anstonellales archaeon]
MKIAIVSDTHFGYKRFYEDAFEQGKESLIKAANMSDVILCPGDIFDSRIPTLETLIKAIEIFTEVKSLNKKIYVIPGTHERRSKELPNPIEILEKANLVINVHNKTEVFENNKEKISISGLGGVPEEFAREALKQLKIQKYEDCFNIFMFHQTIQELMPIPMPEVMSLEDLPKGYDLYICGHYHKKKLIVERKKNFRFVIPGSTVLTQLKEEEQEQKGFFVYDTKKDEFEFISIKSRPFYVINLNFDKASNTEINDKIYQEVEKIFGTKSTEINNEKKKSIIKIVLTGTLKNSEILNLNLKEIEEKCILEVQNLLEDEENKKEIEELKGIKMQQGGNLIREVFLNTLKKYPQLDSKTNWHEIFEIFSEDDEKEHEKIIDMLLKSDESKS